MSEKNRLLIARIYDAVTSAFDEAGIVTLDMAPWREPVGYSVGPSTISLYFRLRYPVRDLPRALKLAAPIEMHVAPILFPSPHRAPSHVEVRVSQAGAFLQVDIPRPDRRVLRIQDVAGSVEKAFWLGQDVRGQPVAADLLGLSAGVLVVGSSGTGKTNAIAWLVIQALAKGWDFYLVDLKGGQDWVDLERYAIMRAYTSEDASHVLAVVQEIITSRNSTSRNSRRATVNPPVLFVFDELLLASEQQQKTLAQISVVGRSAQVRVIAGTQRLGNSVQTVVKQNLRYRLVGRVTSRSEAYEATGIPESGAERLLGKGDMLWITDGLSERVQTPQVLENHHLLPEAVEYLQGVTVRDGTSQMTVASVVAKWEQEAKAMGKGRRVPPAELLEWAVAYVKQHGRPPSHRKLIERSKEIMGVALSQARREEVRWWAMRLAGVVPDVPGTKGGDFSQTRTKT